MSQKNAVTLAVDLLMDSIPPLTKGQRGRNGCSMLTVDVVVIGGAGGAYRPEAGAGVALPWAAARALQGRAVWVGFHSLGVMLNTVLARCTVLLILVLSGPSWLGSLVGGGNC